MLRCTTHFAGWLVRYSGPRTEGMIGWVNLSQRAT